MSESIEVTIEVNGETRAAAVEPGTLLVEFVRDRCGLAGTHVGCLTGDCGACTVLVDGATRKSCLLLAASVDGRSVRTIEGLAPDGSLTAVQSAFWEGHAFQCGFCTAGMVLVVHELLERNAAPTESEVRQAISGNLCRCTGYDDIVLAALRAAEMSAGAAGRKAIYGL